MGWTRQVREVRAFLAAVETAFPDLPPPPGPRPVFGLSDPADFKAQMEAAALIDNKDKGDVDVLEKAYQTKFNASKFSGLESLDKNIRRLITENINALMTDRESLKAFERFCDITVDSKARTT